MEPQKLLLVDGGVLFRDCLALALAGSSLSVLGEVRTTPDLPPSGPTALRPDLVLLDATGLPNQALANLGAVRARYPNAKAVVLSASLTAGSIGDAFAAGACGYLLKDISIRALVECLTLVAMGEKVFPTRLAEVLVANIDKSATQASAAEILDKKLSDRERQILVCLAEGDSNKLIAKKLSIAEATVKVHLKNTLRKINARNRTQAAVWMVTRGSVSISKTTERTV